MTACSAAVGMSGNAVAVWQQAIKALEHCCSITPGGLAEAADARHTVMSSVAHVFQLPPLPKAVWKKLVQLKVPLQLGTAFTSATQHSWKSHPAPEAARELLLQLVRTAKDAGAAVWGSLGSSIRQQLQQSGVLQQLTAVMSAMAADLQAEAATLAAPDADTARPDLEQLVAASPNMMVLKAIGLQYQLMYLWGCKPALPFGFDFVPSATWLWGPSGQVVAAMQLHMALMQHVSALVQHVQQHASKQQAGVLLGQLASNFEAAKPGSLLLNLTAALCNAVSGVGQQAVAADSLQLLLLSPHTLPFVAMVLVIHADGVKRVSLSSSRQTTASSSGSAGSSSRGRSSKGGTGQQERAAASDNSSSSSSGACEQQLLQLLGLAPEVVAMMDSPLNLVDAGLRLCMPSDVCTACMQAPSRQPTGDAVLAEQVQQQLEQWQQPKRWRFEQQLQLLLPIVLLPSVRHMQTPSAQDLQQQLPQVPDAAQRLLFMSYKALQLCALLCENQALPAAPTPSVWLQERLGVLLQLTDLLVYQRPLIMSQPTAATAGTTGASSTLQQQVPAPAEAAAIAGTSRRSSSSSCSMIDQKTLALNVQKLLSMLLGVAWQSRTLLLLDCSSSTSSDSLSSTPDAVSPVATRFVEFGVALEAALRSVTLALHSGLDTSAEPPEEVSVLCATILLPPPGQTSPMLVQHMGLCGPVVLAQEQRQLYSLLSTVLKMGRCKSTGAQAGLCWGERAAGSCCLAAAHAAVGLLTMAAAVGSAASAAATDQQSLSAAAPAAAAEATAPAAAATALAAEATTPAAAAAVAVEAAQQPAIDYLPSLVIFGRCCLQWAEQLSEQTPYLLLLGSEALPQDVPHRHRAHFACIIPKRQGPAGQGESVWRGLIATVSSWVGSLDSHAALTQLQAAGCAPQQLQQQLEVLLLVHQGMHLGQLTDASLAALVQQLQATGSMLCNIAVPHFCNNPACANLSGPTEVQLVSGRSCVCGGCRTARYCGRACQRAAWRQHKPVCEALAAAAAAAPAE